MATLRREEAAGDIFKSRAFPSFGSYAPDHLAYGHTIDPASKKNELYCDESEHGLKAPPTAGRKTFEDDLDALEEADTKNSFWGIDTNVDDIVDTGKFAFFSLNDVSPSIIVPTILDLGTDDILVATNPGSLGFKFDIYANGSTMGLQSFDVLDALALSDIG